MLTSIVDTYYNIRNYFEGTYTSRIVTNFFDLFISIFPYLLISIAINILSIRVFKKARLNFSTNNEILSIFSGAAIGLISPIPTYAAIPIGLSLGTAGIPFSAIISFIISSPLMNPTVFFLTATQMGMEMAIVRSASAFIIAVIGGLITMKISKFIYVRKSVSTHTGNKNNPLKTEIYKNSKYILKTFSVAILLSAAVKSLVPQNVLERLLGGSTASGTLVAMGLGIPFYTCGGAAIPFMETLYSLGMSKGAILAFFLTGPATKLETLYAYKTLLGIKVLIFYLVLTLVFSFFAGMLYSAF